MKKKKYLPLYKKWLKTGKIGTDDIGYHNGLCNSVELQYDRTLELFEPTDWDNHQLKKEGLSDSYWACGMIKNQDGNESVFSPLRQTIVLFMAAMNGEL